MSERQKYLAVIILMIFILNWRTLLHVQRNNNELAQTIGPNVLSFPFRYVFT